jgi:hypothetical protein
MADDASEDAVVDNAEAVNSTGDLAECARL